MTNQEKFEICLKAASELTRLSKLQYPYPTYNYVGTTALLVSSLIATVAAAGVSAVGMYAQGQAQKKMGEYNSKIAENNAIASRQQAQAEADRIRSRGARLRGAQVAAASKSGITLSGSVNDVIFDSSVENELDALTAIYKGSVSASAYQSQGTLARFEGDTAYQAGLIGAGGSILSGAGQSFGYATKISQVRNNPQFGS